MARRTHDLLDVFRAPAPAAPGPAARGPAAARRRMRLALGGSIAGLLVVLAFTLGLALSKRGGRPAERTDLALASVRRGEWIVRAETARASPTGAKDLSTVVPRELARRWPDLAKRVRIAPGETKASMKVIVTGFRSRAEADHALSALAVWSVEASFPFRRGVVVEIE